MPNNKVIVKVGVTSILQLRDAKVYRAITLDELRKLSELQDDANIIIIEKVYQEEYEQTCSFLKEFTKLENKQVFFFSPDNDTITTGAADELALDIYMSLKDLYHAIKVNCGLNMDPDISIIRDEMQDLFDGSDDPFKSDFETFNDAIEAAKQSVTKDIDVPMELPDIRSKSSTNTYFTDEDLGIDEAFEVEDTVENQPEVAELVDNNDTSDTSDEDCVTSEELSQAKQELESANMTIADLKSQLTYSKNRLDELNKVIKAVKDERDALQAEFNGLETAPLIEDPATLDEYNKLQSRIAELEELMKNSSSATSEEVEQLKTNVTELEEKLTLLEAERVELVDKNAELEIRQAELQQQLVDATNDKSKDNRIAELTEQISELSNEIDGLNSRVNAANTSINDKNVEIEDLTSKLDLEKASRLELFEILRNAVQSLTEVETLREQLGILQETNNSLNDEVINLRVSLDDARVTNDKLKGEADTRVEIAKNYAREETETTRRENIAIKAQLDFIKAQLLAKETQYNMLIQTTGIDENGAMAVVENNKTLEAINSNLRSQLSELKTAYELSERDKTEARQAADVLRDQKEKLSRQIKVISTGYSGGASVGVIPAIAYQGRGQIVTVVGSGSYGITTTAISTAINLAAQGRVLFIDFDMISAKADSWFKMTPIIQGLPNMSSRSERNTGLGLLVERGAQYFIGYSTAIIRKVIATKNGWVDYVSGLYDRPDVVKLVATDFTSFLNFCGNNYDYLVIDFGRLGASDINNQMIKIFSDISKSTIIVSCSDKIDIRNTRIEIQRTRINMDRAAWLVNLAENTKLDDASKNHISPASAMVMPFVSDFYGQRKDFSKDRVSRDKFNVFVEKSVFRR